MQDAQLLLCRVFGGVFGGFRETQAAVLVMDVEEQSSVFQPLLLPAYKRDVLGVAGDLCQIERTKTLLNKPISVAVPHVSH